VKLKDLQSQRRLVESEIAVLQKELEALDVLISSQCKREGVFQTASWTPSSNGDGERQRRVRGTLKAAKEAVSLFGVPFTRSDLFNKIEQLNPSLTGKIKAEAQRGTMRTLATERYIEPTGENRGEEALYRDLGKRD
jgi:hypothetical protein